MLEIFNRKCRILISLFLILTTVYIRAQDKKDISNIEKVYLHTDRSTYFIGEDLWYKAYNVRASNNLLFDNSNILYVELISSDSKIIARNKTNLEMGLGHGDFQLQDSLGVKPGAYELRAYTNWNRNFGDDFVFKKDIEVLDLFESNANSKINQKNVTESTTTKRSISKENPFRIDFFPEGGSLLENVASVVGFKAVDFNGKPIDISGEIYDSDNELVSSFQSSHDGMGKCQLLPIEGKSYYARIKTSTGLELRQELPNILKQGYLISFRVFKGKNIITISTNPSTLSQNVNAALTIIGKAKGITYLETKQTLTETTLSFELPKDKFPEGISQITLFDNNDKPQSERLIYIEKEQDLDVQLLTDKITYQPNEKVSVSISSKSKEGAAKSASFSLSVTDMNGIEDKDLGTTISSYFLMESDIKGKVYHPAYYFDKTNPKRLEHLDNLLLTQGWRDFVWRAIPKTDDKFSYKAEKGISISGRVKQLFADKPLVNNNLTLALMSKKNRNIFNTVTDSIGSFQFENLIFSGKTKMYLNTRDDKGKFRGEIVLDSIEQAPISVVFKKELMNLLQTKNLVAENVLKKYTAFGVKQENILKEVIVTATTKKKDDIVANYGNYGFADRTYVADEDTHLYSTIGELLTVMFADTSGVFIVDGRRIYPHEKPSWVDNIQPSDIVKIDVINGAQATLFFGEEGEKGIVAIYTKPNTGNKPKKDSFQSIKKEIEGFYTARIFYMPDPDKLDVELDKKAAVRNTIYWNPYVHPDKTGNVSVSYDNTKVETKVKVALEGITGTGIPVVKNAYYIIKN
jgi:hypothetical protein